MLILISSQNDSDECDNEDGTATLELPVFTVKVLLLGGDIVNMADYSRHKRVPNVCILHTTMQWSSVQPS